MSEITEDDIRIGSTADIKWTNGKGEEIFPAVLQKTRVKFNKIQYRVHYKNWNKRYDEWISLDYVMRIYDDDGNLLKARVPLNQDAKGEDRDNGNESNDDGPPLRKSTRRARKRNPGKSVFDSIESDSEGEEDVEAPAEENSAAIESDVKELFCASESCGKPAQQGSIYCSVDCILAQANVAKKIGKAPPEELSPPPLEPGGPDQHVDSDSDDDFIPPEDVKPTKARKPKKFKPEKKSSKNVKPDPVTPKKPKGPKKLTEQDIEDIMESIADLKDSDPIIVLKHGQLLTGYHAPKKSNLREFLEENPIGVKVVLNKKKNSEEKKKEKSKAAIHDRMRSKLDAAKAEMKKVVYDAGSNPYAASEQKNYDDGKAERKAKKEEKKKKRLSMDKAAMEAAQESKKDKKKGLISDDTLDLMRAVNARKNEKAAKEKKDKKSEKERRKSDSDRKRLNSTGASMETPPKKARRESLPLSATPDHDARPTDERSFTRKRLREILQNRSQASGDHGSEKLTMNLESIAKLVFKIEKHMFKTFVEVNKDYKTKFRQIQFNLQDAKNDYFWRRVITGEISASSMHKMSSNDMGSIERLKEREKQQKDSLEQVLKLEAQKQREALKPTAKITHKGEVEIERFDDAVDRSTIEVTSTSLNSTSNDEATDAASAKTDLDNPRSTSKITQLEAETIEKLLQSKSAQNLLNDDVYEPMDTSGVDGDLPEARTPDYVYNPESPNGGEPTSDQEMKTPERPDNSVTEHFEPAPIDAPSSPSSKNGSSGQSPDEQSTNALQKVWSGKLHFPEGTSFRANGYTISGQVTTKILKKSLPKEFKFAGQLSFNDVGEYINQLRQTSDPSRICVMSLYGISASEEESYRTGLQYLAERGRIGVVKTEGDAFKDIYIVPLGEDEELPNWLTPMSGPGLDDDHPAIMLLVMIKKSERKKRPDREHREKHRSRERSNSGHHSATPEKSEDVTSKQLPITDEIFEDISDAIKLLTPQTLPAPAPWNDVPPPVQPIGPPREHTADYYDHQPSFRDSDMRSKPNYREDRYDDRGWDQRPPRDDYSYRGDRAYDDRGSWHNHHRGRGGGRGRGNYRERRDF